MNVHQPTRESGVEHAKWWQAQKGNIQMADITIRRNEENGRYEAVQGNEVVGYIDFSENNGIVDLPHTKVDPGHEGQGIGSTLVHETLSDLRYRGHTTITPTCPFIASYIEKHQEFAPMVAGKSNA